MYKQGNARGTSEVRRGSSPIPFHCPVPRSSGHIGDGFGGLTLGFHWLRVSLAADSARTIARVHMHAGTARKGTGGGRETKRDFKLEPACRTDSATLKTSTNLYIVGAESRWTPGWCPDKNVLFWGNSPYFRNSRRKASRDVGDSCFAQVPHVT